jgi:hypothetical protein
VTALAAIHTGLRQLGIADDDKRDLYERVTGKRSLTDMSPKEQDAVIGELRRLGFRPAKRGLEGPFAKKLQALWIAAWNLGLVEERRDHALLAFVRRQTNIDHTRFLIDSGEADKVIQALKGWMARDGGVDWRVSPTMPDWQRRPGAKVAIAQWAMLVAAGAEASGFPGFKAFVEDHAFHPLDRMTDREWQGVTNTLGRRVRKEGGR